MGRIIANGHTVRFLDNINNNLTLNNTLDILNLAKQVREESKLEFPEYKFVGAFCNKSGGK